MRFVTIYLAGYAALIVGAVVALWAGGALPHIGPARLIVALAVALGFGLLLARASRQGAEADAERDEEP